MKVFFNNIKLIIFSKIIFFLILIFMFITGMEIHGGYILFGYESATILHETIAIGVLLSIMIALFRFFLVNDVRGIFRGKVATLLRIILLGQVITGGVYFYYDAWTGITRIDNIAKSHIFLSYWVIAFFIPYLFLKPKTN